MKLTPICTGNLKLDGGAMFGVVPKVIWNKLYPSDENNLCNWSMRCLLIEDEGRKILIDNGIGNKQSEKFLGLYHLNGEETLIGSLADAGVRPEDITDVILTHLHFDHCGGSVRWNAVKTGYELNFQNADHYVSQRQWDWANHPNNREKASYLKDNILPIQESGKLKLLKDDIQLFPNVYLKQYHGHSDGQMIPFITYKGRTIVFMADLLPSAAHIPLPYVMSYDTRPLITMEEKDSFLQEAVAKKFILFFEHDIYHEACTVSQTEKGIRTDTFLAVKDLT